MCQDSGVGFAIPYSGSLTGARPEEFPFIFPGGRLETRPRSRQSEGGMIAVKREKSR